jgi:hypothetical protein
MPPVLGRCGTAGGGASNVPVGGATPNVYGVWGDCRDRYGLVGTSRTDMGLSAVSAEYIAAFGESQQFVGVWGQCFDPAGAGVVGAGGQAGVLGLGGSPGYAGLFYGDVHVSGRLTVGTLPKPAVVPHPDGTQRIVSALESPESWFEDFGRAEVIEGRARVELDDDFAALVGTDDYHVFVTPEGESNGLYVSARTAREFEVRDQGEGTSTLSFSYRIVARPKGVEPDRLPVFEPPPAPPELRPRPEQESR